MVPKQELARQLAVVDKILSGEHSDDRIKQFFPFYKYAGTISSQTGFIRGQCKFKAPPCRT